MRSSGAAEWLGAAGWGWEIGGLGQLGVKVKRLEMGQGRKGDALGEITRARMG